MRLLMGSSAQVQMRLEVPFAGTRQGTRGDMAGFWLSHIMLRRPLLLRRSQVLLAASEAWKDFSEGRTSHVQAVSQSYPIQHSLRRYQHTVCE